MNEHKKPAAARAPWKREDALIWALKAAETQVPVSDVLADAAMICEYLGGELSPVESAIVTVQRYRDRLPGGAHLPDPHGVGVLDEFLHDLIRDLRDPVIDAEVVEEPDWAEVSRHADLIAERDEARSQVVELGRQLEEARTHLVKGALLRVKRFQNGSPAEEMAVRQAVHLAADQLGVTL